MHHGIQELRLAASEGFDLQLLGSDLRFDFGQSFARSVGAVALGCKSPVEFLALGGVVIGAALAE